MKLFLFMLYIYEFVYCPNCDYNLASGTEKFCPECSYRLAPSEEERAINIGNTSGDVLAAGISGSANVTAKDTKGSIFYFNIGSISPDQLKNIITSSATLDVSQSQIRQNINLQKVTETKQETSKVLDELDRIEKKEGKEIHEINIGDLQISKNELSLKEIILKGNEHFYKKEYTEAIECYDKALKIDPNYAGAWNRGFALQQLGKYREAIKSYDKAIEINPNNTIPKDNKTLLLSQLNEKENQLSNKKIKWYTSDGKPVYD